MSHYLSKQQLASTEIRISVEIRFYLMKANCKKKLPQTEKLLHSLGITLISNKVSLYKCNSQWQHL